MEIKSEVKKSVQAAPNLIWNIKEAVLELLWRYLQKEAGIGKLKCEITQKESWFLVATKQIASKGKGCFQNLFREAGEKIQEDRRTIYYLIEEKEELSLFEIDLDEDMYS